MSIIPIEVLRLNPENAAARLQAKKLAIANIHCVSDPVDLSILRMK